MTIIKYGECRIMTVNGQFVNSAISTSSVGSINADVISQYFSHVTGAPDLAFGSAVVAAGAPLCRFCGRVLDAAGLSCFACNRSENEEPTCCGFGSWAVVTPTAAVFCFAGLDSGLGLAGTTAGFSLPRNRSTSTYFFSRSALLGKLRVLTSPGSTVATQ